MVIVAADGAMTTAMDGAATNGSIYGSALESSDALPGISVLIRRRLPVRFPQLFCRIEGHN